MKDSVQVEDTAMLQDVRLDIIYDNYPHPEGEITLWGFSCLIRNTQKTILFDAGDQGDSLMANMAALGIDPKIIELVVISHDHADHTRGLGRLIPESQSPQVILLESFSSELKEQVKVLGGKVVENSKSVEICPYVFTTGEMQGRATEQALVLQTRGGLIVITGCAHPGVVNIVKCAREMLEGEILLVMGGFHLLQHSREAVNGIISELQDLSVKYVAPTHCTGDIPRQIFKDAYGDNFIELEIGSTITLSDLMDEK
ncbi:MAG: MBL fold metallo-hydrolase [FCB group bacterium]|nr:MBL fold metallo-hydrolase [FCB group bacterium]